MLLEGAYPVEASLSNSAALFHWVDSLANTSGGKTVSVYQREFDAKFGAPDAKDLEVLRRFQSIRAQHAGPPAPGRPARGASAMLGMFLEGPDLDASLTALRPDLGAENTESLRGCLEHFGARYAVLWQDGAIARGFLEQARGDRRRKDLEDLLARVAKFFSADLSAPRPRVVLVPVAAGGGTHAEAVGRNLLIEVRPGESLADQVAPIIHENAHFLWNRVPTPLRGRLTQVAAETPSGNEALALTREALPTALGQGVGGRAFLGSAWTVSTPWYHVVEVDAYAKALYPTVQAALDTGARLDDALFRRLLRLFPQPAKKGAKAREPQPAR